jgi:SAM-dependent methyltransferase
MNTNHDFKRQDDLVERLDYKPTHPQEVFMLAVLKQEIDSLINDYAVINELPSKILDVGCGRQPFRSDFESRGYIYFGLDVQQSPENSVEFICEIDKNLPLEVLKQAPFNFVFCTEVMEHVADWDSAFNNFSKLLAPGGKLLITCPSFYPLHEEPHDFWRATPYALQFYGSKFDFKILRQGNSGNTWDVLGTLLGCSSVSIPINRKIATRIINRCVRFGHRLLLKLLLSGFLQSHSQLNSSLYLANTIVFEK